MYHGIQWNFDYMTPTLDYPIANTEMTTLLGNVLLE